MAITTTPGKTPCDGVLQYCLREEGDAVFVQRHVEVLTLARGLSMVQSRQSGDGGVGSCDRVGVEERATIGPIVVRITGCGREPAASLDIGAVRDVVTVRTGLAEVWPGLTSRKT